MEKSELVIGGLDCPIKTIMWVITSNATTTTLKENWTQFAMELGVPEIRIRKFKQDMLLKKITASDIIRDVLELWGGWNGSRATLNALLNILEVKLKENELGEFIRLKFNYPCKISSDNSQLKWEHISPAYQKRVRDNLEKLSPSANNDYDEALQNLKGHALHKLMTGKTSQLFHHTLPNSLSYYIDRKILTRHILSKSHIFMAQTAQDIFLFTGINAEELNELVKGKMISSSTKQLSSLSGEGNMARFLILDQPNHFGRIADKTEHPVHWLHQEDDGRLKWMRSKGEMMTIHECLSNSQDNLDEERFLKDIYSDPRNQPICISDGPGMGKSVLLAQIGRRLITTQPEKTVLFLNLDEFIQQIRNNGSNNKISSIESALLKLACEDDLEKIILKTKLRSRKGITIELMLDGFDEVRPALLEFTLEILKTIHASCTSVRLWVTTRSHFLEELENSLNTLGYNIEPFSEENQIRFLTSYWPTQEGQHNLEKMQEFAGECLKMVKANISSQDQDIAGVPLLCSLIGEVYEEEAVAYCTNKGRSSSVPKVLINSITELYEYLISKKFQKYLTVHVKDNFAGVQEVTDMHVGLSLEMIFPHQFENLKRSLGHIEIEEVLKIGIVEASGTTAAPRFKHRTLAEFFIARFIAEKISRGQTDWTPELEDFFFNGLMSNKRSHVWLNINSKWVDSFEFTHGAICYFFNSLIPSHILPNSKLPDSDLLKSLDRMKRLAHATTQANLVKFFHFLHQMNTFDDHGASKIFDYDFLLLAIKFANSELVKFVVALFQQHDTLDHRRQIEAFRLAVQRGGFSIVEFLLKEKQFDRILELSDAGARYLLHDCVVETSKNTGPEIEQKIQIIRLLVTHNPKLLEAKDEKGNTPIHSHHVHVQLLIELAQCGASLISQDASKDNILHLKLPRDHLSLNDYHSLLSGIPQAELRKLVSMKGEFGHTPLGRMLEKTDPSPEILKAFKVAGAEFSTDVDDKGYSMLAIAIEWRRKVATLRKLIDLGEDLNWHGMKNESLLHIAGAVGHAGAVKMLLEESQSNVNAEDEDKLTPLDYVIKSKNAAWDRIETGLILKKSGGKHMQFINAEGETWLHLSAREGNLKSVQFLHNLGMDANSPDQEGNTPLHSLQTGDWSPSKIAILKHLLDSNANLDVSNKDGDTPFDLALKNGTLDIETFQLIRSKANIKWTRQLATFAMKLVIQQGKDLDDLEFNSHVLEFTNHGSDFKYKDSLGNSLLHIAAASDNDKAVHWLIENHSGDNIITWLNDNQETVLHKAATVKDGIYNVKMIQYLVDHGADVDAQDKDKWTFVHQCASYKNFELPFHSIVNYLVEKGLCHLLNIQDQNGVTPLHLAVGRMEIYLATLELLNFTSVNINTVSDNGESVLFYAVQTGKSTEFLSTLVKLLGADWRLLTDHGCSLLHYSSQVGTLESLKFFLNLGGLNVNGADMDGDTPAHCASLKANGLEKFKLLIERGADVNILNSKGETPLDIASVNWDPYEYKSLEAFLGRKRGKIMIMSSTSDSEPTTSQMSPFHLACLEGTAEMLTTQLNLRQVDINQKDEDGNAPLHLVVHHAGKQVKVLEKCKLLLSHGADVNLINTRHETILHIAATLQDKEVGLKVLEPILQGCQQDTIFMKDEDNLTFLHRFLMQTVPPTSDQFQSIVELLLVQNHSKLFESEGGKFGNTPLYEALHKLEPKLETLTLLHSSGINFNQVNNSGASLLVSAVLGRRTTKVLSALVDKFHVNTLQSNNDQENLLHHASYHGTFAALKFILDLGSLDINNQTRYGASPLHFAVFPDSRRTDEFEKCKLLVQHGADLNLSNHWKKSALILAASIKDKEVSLEVMNYLIEHGADVFAKDEDNVTFLHYYLMEPNIPSPAQLHAIVETLVERKLTSAFDSVGSHYGTTPLQDAIFNLEPELKTLSQLYSHGVNFNSVSSRGRSVLTYAIMGRRSTELISNLIHRFGADVKHLGNTNQEGLLHSACYFGTVETLNFLLDLDVLDVNGVTDTGSNPLHFAVLPKEKQIDSLEKCNLLLLKGAEVNAATLERKTAVHLSAFGKDSEVTLQVLNLLLTKGADFTGKDADDLTFLHLYLTQADKPSPDQFHSLVEFLVAENLSSIFDIKGGKGGTTPLHEAFHNIEPKVQTVELLLSAGVNFLAVDDEGNSILSHAVMGKRSPTFISTLIHQFEFDKGHLNVNGENMLHTASYFGNSIGLQFLLQFETLEVNLKNIYGNVPLHFAVQSESSQTDIIEKCKLLIDKGADVNLSDQRGYTALHFAANGKDKDVNLAVLKYLIAAVANVSAEDTRKRTFLHHYILQPIPPTTEHFHSIVELLIGLSHSKLFETFSDEFGTPLQEAVAIFEPQERTLLQLHSGGVNLNAVDFDGSSVLTYAAILGKRTEEFLSNLINRFGVNPQNLNIDRENLLHTASRFGTAETLNFFLKLKVLDIFGRDKDGNTPLHSLVHSNSKQIDVLEKCRSLLNHGADVTLTNDFQESPLHLSAKLRDKEHSLEVIKLLIGNRGDVTAKCGKNLTFLHHFVLQAEKPTPEEYHILIEYLVGQKLASLLNIPGGQYDITPLHVAVTKISKDTSSILHFRGISFNSTDMNGGSILEYAIVGKRAPEFLALLIEYGAKFKVLSKNGNNLLHIASQLGNLEGLKYLLDLGELDINLADSDGDTPLHIAVQQEDQNDALQKCRLLLEYGAIINCYNNEGQTPLSIVSEMYDDGEDKDELMKLLTVIHQV